jgi:hypothetical protein
MDNVEFAYRRILTIRRRAHQALEDELAEARRRHTELQREHSTGDNSTRSSTMRYRQKPTACGSSTMRTSHGARKRVSTGIKSAPQKQPPADVKAAGREIVLGIRTPQGPPLRARTGP